MDCSLNLGKWHSDFDSEVLLSKSVENRPNYMEHLKTSFLHRMTFSPYPALHGSDDFLLIIIYVTNNKRGTTDLLGESGGSSYPIFPIITTIIFFVIFFTLVSFLIFWTVLQFMFWKGKSDQLKIILILTPTINDCNARHLAEYVENL